MHNDTVIVPDNPRDQDLVALTQNNAQRWGLQYQPVQTAGIALVQCFDRVELRNLDEPKVGAVYVDFASDALTYRRQHGGGKQEMVAKAVGIKGQYRPRVLDVTAGLGRDAFVLASLGCAVTMVERSPIVASLLRDGLERAALHAELAQWLPDRMQFRQGLSHDVLTQWSGQAPDVIYLDPMYPHRRKSAAVKKEMRVFQQLLGADDDADLLLEPAMELATKRVVVKRPDYAPSLADKTPSLTMKTKKHRFDVYLIHNKA